MRRSSRKAHILPSEVTATRFFLIIFAVCIACVFNLFILTLRKRYAFLFRDGREFASDDGEEEQIRLLALPLGIKDERTDGYGTEKNERPPR